jgi:transaldolase/glucose-6-phosphate isomerase
LPPETLQAFKDHGKVPGTTIKENVDDAAAVLQRLKALGIDLDEITKKLQQDGVTAFAASFDQLMEALEKKRKAVIGVEPKA